MNIKGMTQLEIEEEFDNTNMKLALNAEMEIFFNNVDEIHFKAMKDILGTENDDTVTNVFIYILSVIGNEKVGIRIGYDRHGQECSVNSKYCRTISHMRDIEIFNLIQAIASAMNLYNITSNPISRFNLAMDITAEFDTILFDLHKKSIQLDDKQWTTITYARSEITFSEEASLRAQYNRFRLPMIEEPDDWTQSHSGGYKLNKSKVTTNKGEALQPQNCLDVLNRLQKQSYMLTPDTCSSDENKYLVEVLKPKSLSFVEAQTKADMLSLTTKETYEALQNIPFYFEWKFDFRGRMYSTGYDINLQANKYKKGALIPC